MPSVTRHPALTMTFMLALAAGGCQSKAGGGTESAATGTPSLEGTARSVDTATTSSTDSAKKRKGGLNETTILGMLDAADKADSAGGALASKKATDPEVKAYGEMMMQDHHQLREEGAALATKLGVTPTPPERDPIAPYAAAETAAIQKAKKGEEFDQTYIDNEVTVHQAVLDAVNMARVATSNQEIKDLIIKATPVIQRHLEKAQAIQKRLGPSV
ncbi:MAG: DUF4142 domain-containing protein [Gemmatimonadales bacterium]